MRFGAAPLDEALGALLAHSLDTPAGRLRKGIRIDDRVARALRAGGHLRPIVARLDAGDVHEGTASVRLAHALAGSCVRVRSTGTGRCDLFADSAGLLVVDAVAVHEANRVDPAMAIATLPAFARVGADQRIATVKIIPFAVREALLASAVRALGTATLAIAAHRSRRAVLVQTELAHVRRTVLDKTADVTDRRLVARGASLVAERRCPHDATSLSAALGAAATLDDPDWLLVVGASAACDPNDVIPTAIRAAGGSVVRVGMPVEPGNLLVVGHLGERTVVGLPGCARSPANNGVDLVLDRLACGLAVDDAWVESLGVGGLLHAGAERPWLT